MMNAKEAKEALQLQGGLQIDGKLHRVSEFLRGLAFAEKALDMQIKMQDFCDVEDACDCCPYRSETEGEDRCMNDFVVDTTEI